MSKKRLAGNLMDDGSEEMTSQTRVTIHMAPEMDGLSRSSSGYIKQHKTRVSLLNLGL